MEELKKLKLKLITHWKQEDFAFIARLYKDSANKSSAALAAKAITDLDKLSRRQHARELRERSTTKESVAEKGTSNIMAWNQYKTIDTLSFHSKRASSVERLRQVVNPTLTADKTTRVQSPLIVQRKLEPGNNQSLQQPLKSSRSLRRLIEERKVFIKGTTTSPSPPKSPKQQQPLPAVKQEEAKIKLISVYGDLTKRPPSKLKSRNPPMIIPPANPIFSTEAQVQKSYFNIQSAYAPQGRKKQMLLRNKSKDLVVI
ncbi:hypothetical protein FGO68_gene5645 [Halteria grandinella]|uniref:Uncharacterized protein n=1 Tax=Halteria grandinella TaxID=5974 RepID=A0A8J8P113_HALGN|nr:hypothetical protein FGO68_gene5645 [Halteria grandinella]